MDELSRKDYIYKILQKEFNVENKGFSAQHIASATGLRRENVSRELNNLVRLGKAEKVKGKPVKFIPLDLISTKFSTNNSSLLNVSSPFDKLIGAKGSLKKNIKQAVASIMYPPKGLHTLLFGPTGVGKTTFAKTMFNYGLESGKYNKNTPFISFNCADYSGNSQLLMSHLFGHAKGTFTGAYEAKEGLVQLSNNGILFLDEVHRLPPEGQEMLFSILDTGEYRRLGESSNTRKTNLLLFAATTETPDTVLLQTFLRRIPSTIKFASLNESPLSERLQFINHFFHIESINIQNIIKVPREIITLLLGYDCSGNIGQLKSDIQVICANAYVDFLLEDNQNVVVKLSHIHNIIANLDDNKSKPKEEVIKFLSSYDISEFVYNPVPKNTEIEKYLTNESANNFYTLLKDRSYKFFKQGLPLGEIKKIYNEQINEFFDIKKDNANDEIYKEAIFKFVPKNVFEAVKEVVEETAYKFNFEFNDKILYGLALHINTLIKRINQSSTMTVPEYSRTDLLNNQLNTIAETIRNNLSNKLKIDIPQGESAYIALLLSTVSSYQQHNNIGVLVLMHGETAAEDLAQTANTLLNTNIVRYINMSLSEKVSSALERTKKMVRNINQGKGVIILADMGSLVNFGDIITQETGVATKTIKMVSTAMVIEAARKSIFPNMTLDILSTSVIKESSLIGNTLILDDKSKLKSSPLYNFDKCKIKEIVKETVTFIDVDKFFDILLVTIENIGEKNKVNDKSSFQIKTLFHSASMLERVIRNEPFEYYNETSPSFNETVSQVKEEFTLLEETLGISIPNSELQYISEIVEVHK